jgi:hypothetical protein
MGWLQGTDGAQLIIVNVKLACDDIIDQIAQFAPIRLILYLPSHLPTLATLRDSEERKKAKD